MFIIVTDFRLLLKPDRFCLLLAVRRNTVLLWLDFLKLHLIQFIVRLHIFTLKSRECIWVKGRNSECDVRVIVNVVITQTHTSLSIVARRKATEEKSGIHTSRQSNDVP